MLDIGKPLLSQAVAGWAPRAIRRSALAVAEACAFLDSLPTGSVDLIFADPPYLLSNGGTTCSGGKRAPVDKGGWDASGSVGADHQFHRSWLARCLRVLSPAGSLWVSGTQHSIFSCGWALQSGGWELINTITWFKPNASPNLSCRMLTHSCELLIWAAPARRRGPMLHTFNDAAARAANGGKQLRDFWPLAPAAEHEPWQIPATPKSEKAAGRHPTQKPLALLERVIEISTKPGAVVLDPFMGSGTTGVAADKLGRIFVGCDLDPAFVELAERRIAANVPG